MAGPAEPEGSRDTRLHELEALAARFEKAAEASARIQFLEEAQRLEQRIQEENRARYKRLSILVGVLAGVVSIVSFFGMRQKIAALLDERILAGFHSELERQTTPLVQALQADREEVARVRQIVEKTYADLPRNHLIALLSDFGGGGTGMSTLRATLLRFHPRARVHDITDQIEPFDRFAAAWTLRRAVAWHPPDTIFLAIVAPGDLTDQPLIVRTRQGHTLLGYANGVFDFVVRRYGHAGSYKVDWSGFLTQFRSTPLATAAAIAQPDAGTPHPTRVLAPIAATLAVGDAPWLPPKSLRWTEITHENESYEWTREVSRFAPEVRPEARAVLGTLMQIDRFGNAITNVTREDLMHVIDLEKMQDEGLLPVLHVRVGKRRIELPIVQSYDSVDRGRPLSRIGTNDLLELAVAYGSFAEKYDVEAKDRISVCAERRLCIAPTRASEPPR